MLLAGIETRWHAALNGGTSLTGNSFGSWCATTYDRHIPADPKGAKGNIKNGEE